jgi:hypothetical protein
VRVQAALLVDSPQLPQDRIRHTLDIRQNLVIPETDNPPAFAGQPSRATLVIGTPIMLTAISLNHQPVFDAGKVKNKGTERMLAAKFIVLQTPALKCRLKAALHQLKKYAAHGL